MKPLLVTVGTITFFYATASFLTGFTSDFLVSAIAAVLALGGVVLLDHLDAEHARMARFREDVWHRRIEELER